MESFYFPLSFNSFLGIIPWVESFGLSELGMSFQASGPKCFYCGAAEMPQCLRTLVLAEGWVLIPSTHMAAKNHQFHRIPFGFLEVVWTTQHNRVPNYRMESSH